MKRMLPLLLLGMALVVAALLRSQLPLAQTTLPAGRAPVTDFLAATSGRDPWGQSAAAAAKDFAGQSGQPLDAAIPGVL